MSKVTLKLSEGYKELADWDKALHYAEQATNSAMRMKEGDKNRQMLMASRMVYGTIAKVKAKVKALFELRR